MRALRDLYDKEKQATLRLKLENDKMAKEKLEREREADSMEQRIVEALFQKRDLETSKARR